MPRRKPYSEKPLRLKAYTANGIKPPVRFRLYPEKRGGLFLVANVWATHRDLLTYGRQNKKRWGNHCRGACDSYEKWDCRNGFCRKSPAFADLHFYRSRLTMEVVTHEVFHATIAWARRVKFDMRRLDSDDSINKDEERITYVHGRLCRDFMVRAIDLGLYGPGNSFATE